MDWMELIAAFRDTLRIAESAKMAGPLKTAKASTRVYPEEYRAQIERLLEKNTKITVEENTTFAAANRYRSLGKTAVLNFANPVTPGGGVKYGAMAQEECLCRSSNLYLCLTASPFPDYYGYHASMDDPFYSDRLLYTQGVTVFKNDDEIPKLLPEKEWFQVDVITCAAPYLSGNKYINREALKELFKRRIKNIFEAALDNGVEVLILGAFGCGAFKNPPDVVAAAFREVITENQYDRLLDQIVFAVKESANKKNYQAFLDAFCPPAIDRPLI